MINHGSISDHSHIYGYRKISVSLPSKDHSTVNYKKFKNFDRIKFHNDISLQNWNHTNEFDNPNDMWHAWKTAFNCVLEKPDPLCTRPLNRLGLPLTLEG